MNKNMCVDNDLLPNDISTKKALQAVAPRHKCVIELIIFRKILLKKKTFGDNWLLISLGPFLFIFRVPETPGVLIVVISILVIS